MTKKISSSVEFTPTVLDRDFYEKRRVIKQLPNVHQTETLQKFFGASVDHLFDPGKAKSINGYVGQKPLWYDPDQDYYLEELNSDREFYQLEASMVSRSTEGQVTNLLPYPDLINQLRFQGALVNDHNRLFSQEFYSWCPPVDLDKLLNFRQYVWLPESLIRDHVIEVQGPRAERVANGSSVAFALPGFAAGDDVALRTFYDLAILRSSLISVTVDGESREFTYNQGASSINFVVAPALDAEVVINIHTDLENNVLGRPSADPRALGGVQLSSGMRIKLLLDRNTDYKISHTYIVENVGRSIELIREEAGVIQEPNYLTIARGSVNRNEWSRSNRWFHVETLPQGLDPDLISENRAARPIVEFDRDLELFSYGRSRRRDVDVSLHTVEDVGSLLAQNPTSVTLSGVTFSTAENGKISVSALDPDTNEPYGLRSSARILVRNSSNDLINDRVSALINQDGALKLILEIDGDDPSGLPAYGEVIKVKLGQLEGENLFWDGSSWTLAQRKARANQAPLFELYDLNGTSLADPVVYPGSNFKGNAIFGYDVDEGGFRPSDDVLGFPVLHDNKGQMLFRNFLATTTYQHVIDGESLPTTGFYFHNTLGESDVLGNDWFKAPGTTSQAMVDRFVATGRTKLFKISQDTPDTKISLGRVQEGGSFERADLVENRDFVRSGREVMFLDIKVGDVIEVRTKSSTPPPQDATGEFEVPLNLQANPDNAQVTSLTKGDFYDHFSGIIKSQANFTGAEYSVNSWRDTARQRNLGTHIIQHSSGLLKTMLLASDQRLDVTAAIRFAEGEYARFKEKFHQTVMTYDSKGLLGGNLPSDELINAVLADVNKGKTKKFPFYLSRVAVNSQNQLPTYIPATPSFMGLYPLYAPEMIAQDVTNSHGVQVPAWFVKGHDGSIVQGRTEACARAILALEMRIYESVPGNIKNRERPICDWQVHYGDQLRTSTYSYDEFLTILQPSFERWSVTYRQDHTTNDIYSRTDPWTWNWSSVTTVLGATHPGHWRGIYEKFFGTQRPDLTPWESLGFTRKPSWWDERYGEAPYTCDNTLLWTDIEAGFIFAGDRQGINPQWARPGLTNNIPVDPRGRLRHPGPRHMTSLAGFLAGDLSEDDLQNLEHTADYVLGCGICPSAPVASERDASWRWGDLSPVEQIWRRSSSFGFAIAQASYLMRPAEFVELGWNTDDLALFFKGEPGEQYLSQDTKGRSPHASLRIHGETLSDLTQVYKTGVQQWISDFLINGSVDVNTSLANRIRGLRAQLSYKVGGFTDASTLVVVSDSFGRVPSEDVSVNLYRSPSLREETYSGVAIQKVSNGFEIMGYDATRPFFSVIPGSESGARTSVGGGARATSIPSWRSGTYFSVNVTVRYGNQFFRCLKTHTSSTEFEEQFWVEVARPDYADGTSLTWSLEAEFGSPVNKIAYGTTLRTPQDVANFMNSYERYLTSRGWIFDHVDDHGEIRGWQNALESFIIWSTNSAREEGDFITLSPANKLVKFSTEHGMIQPVEQIINGLYAIVDQNGQPIDPQATTVVRSDGEITISCSSSDLGIFGLRLYVSEVEHVLIFNNETIFNDTIYNPLLNIHQPRLRLQGFKTVAWRGRVDAPGFIITGDRLTPNFERSADDFRRFFETESMENKTLQDRARANFGYEERDYLNNLLLTPTNQFEFYQGMIQQKGSPTSMRRLLRSNFIRHNKGLRLFEEWAFRVGDYGSADASPTLDINIRQSEFKHNPQLITFDRMDAQAYDNLPPEQKSSLRNPYGVIKILDLVNDGRFTSFDDRWRWRPAMDQIKWPTRDFGEGDPTLPTAGYVKLDEVSHGVATQAEMSELFSKLELADPLRDGDRVWCYGVGSKLSDGSHDMNRWTTHKFSDSGLRITGVTTSPNGSSLAVLSAPLLGFVDRNSDPQGFFFNQPGGERVFIKEESDVSTQSGSGLTPRFHGSLTTELRSTVEHHSLMFMRPEAGTHIRGIKVEIIEPLAPGSYLTIGHENDERYWINLPTSLSRDIRPTNYASEGALINTPDVKYVAGDDPLASIELIRVGPHVNFCEATKVNWTWTRDDGVVESGEVEFISPSDFDSSMLLSSAYLTNLVVSMPLDRDSMSGTLVISINGVQQDSKTISVVRSDSAGLGFVDVTKRGTYEIRDPAFYPKSSTEVDGLEMLANLVNTGFTGLVRITVDYFYTKGFEVTRLEEDELVDVDLDEETRGGVFTWVPTRFSTFAALEAVSLVSRAGLWRTGDIVEVDSSREDSGMWSVYRRSGSTWARVRRQNRRINSDLITSASVSDGSGKGLKVVLQLYDPHKGYIPGIADRELDFKTINDPAAYDDGLMTWGSQQVGKLWWDLSTTRYLDYEINDSLSGGHDYSWKNWGRMAPGSKVDIYQWVRSTVLPIDWKAYTGGKAALSETSIPSGEAGAQTKFVTAEEWNDELQIKETAFYFWVKNATTVPLVRGRELSALQISSIIQNPVANDIPFFAVIDSGQVIVGGVKQFLSEEDTTLKIKWNTHDSQTANYHKQWSIIREEDERNTIHESLWNKMRDSIVGWDSTQVNGQRAPLMVPDPILPKAQQVGGMIRPRQSWFPADVTATGQRASRSARSAFVDAVNDVLAQNPYVDQWYDWGEVFETGEALPSADRYVTTALDLVDLNLLLPSVRNAVQVGECVLVQNTTEVTGFWTLWRMAELGGQRTFILEDFQKWRMKEGELWSLTDWYASGWNAGDFPNYRFSTHQDRDRAGNLDITLLKGTLVQIDQQSVSDLRWSWDVYTSQSKYQVAKEDATMRLNDAFFDEDRVAFGDSEVNEILSQPDDQRITVARIGELRELVTRRDGSRELEFMLNSFKDKLLTTMDRNKIFFSMVKSAFKHGDVDWAFKTSFLYLGGYSEVLRQSPVAFKDQIDNVIAYLEEVKPYHVKIREYVRRLSYGPDVARMATTDFDKPVYPDGQRNRILDPNNVTDKNIMSVTRPWKDWMENYSKTNYDLRNWDGDWNPVRRTRIKIKLDRVSCSATLGWNTHPWDPTIKAFSQRDTVIKDLSSLRAQYRTGATAGVPNPYNDATVETIEERNLLVRRGDVTASRPGSIVTVTSEERHYMWTGSTWVEFEALGWNRAPNQGTATRVEESYQPQLGMPRKSNTLIEGCDFDGTVLTGRFQSGIWDLFEWNSTGFSREALDRIGLDSERFDGNTTPKDEADSEYIGTTGNSFSQARVNGGRPHELVNIIGMDSLVIREKDASRSYGLNFINNAGKQERLAAPVTGATLVSWDREARSLVVSAPPMLENAQGFTPLHDPQRPSVGFIKGVALSRGYRSTSQVDMTSSGTKTFKLRDVTQGEIPSGLMGSGARVAIVNTADPSKRAIGVIAPSKGSEKDWNGSIQVTTSTDHVDLGSGKSWNIIPLDAFNEPGVIWVGGARFTYTSMVDLGDGTYQLINALLSGTSLAPLEIGDDATVDLVPGGAIYDGSLHRRSTL